MQKYIGTKQIEARPMTRGDYNNYRGWQIPAEENPADEGYLVRYSDGYESWSPEKQFNEAYRPCDNMTQEFQGHRQNGSSLCVWMYQQPESASHKTSLQSLPTQRSLLHDDSGDRDHPDDPDIPVQ